MIVTSLVLHERAVGGGRAYGDNVGFLVNLSGRKSFSPDAGWYVGDLAQVNTMKFITGAPAFAVEVRSDCDYKPRAERAIKDKIRDYFAAGTLVVWDVDLLDDDVIRKYTSNAPSNPTIYRRGEIADAEPAVRGWTIPVDDVFK